MRREKLSDPYSVETAAGLDSYKQELCNQLAIGRRALGLRQQDIANRSFKNQSQVSDFENGRADPQFGTIQSYHRALDVGDPVLELFPQNEEVALQAGKFLLPYSLYEPSVVKVDYDNVTSLEGTLESQGPAAFWS